MEQLRQVHGETAAGSDKVEPRDTKALAGERRSGVVLVDENAALLQTLRGILHDCAVPCFGTGDTLEALCLVVEHRPAFVLLDADAGPLVPWQFCALLRQHPEHACVEVVISSARDDDIERARASAAGAAHFLAKPFTREEVLRLFGGREQA